MTQHLLQGFGFAPNTRFIQIAKNNREISDVAFRLQITTTVDQIENMYWDLVYAYENVRVQKEQLAFAQKTLSDNQKQVEIGTLAPIEVVRAQSTVASNQQTLTLALTNLQLQQLLMKNALSRTLVDPALADAEVIPTSTMELPAQEAVVPTQDLVNDALAIAPNWRKPRINLTNTEISNKAIRSALLPTVDLFAYYGGSGPRRDRRIPVTSAQATRPISCARRTSTRSVPSVGYGGTLNQLVNSTAPDKGAGITINIPLRNRAAQATQVRSEFEYRQAQLRIQQIENQVRIEVRNAQFGVQQNRASVASAQAAVDLARQSLDAEQKKYALGASTSTLVLQNQAALTQAEVTLVSAKAAYEKAEVELDRAIGLLLDHAGIQIADAERGQVTHAPNIPHVAARPADQPRRRTLRPNRNSSAEFLSMERRASSPGVSVRRFFLRHAVSRVSSLREAIVSASSSENTRWGRTLSSVQAERSSAGSPLTQEPRDPLRRHHHPQRRSQHRTHAGQRATTGCRRQRRDHRRRLGLDRSHGRDRKVLRSESFRRRMEGLCRAEEFGDREGGGGLDSEFGCG